MVHLLSTAEVCDLLGISKSTLFRWEKEGLLGKVARDPQHNQRWYGPETIKAVATLTLRRQFSHLERADDPLDSWVRFSLAKLLWGDLSAVCELQEYPTLSLAAIRHIVEVALRFYSEEPSTFVRLLQTASAQAEKLDLHE